ncbi:hypothetical protein EVB97_155 [Rhizobium phage RHph_Y65]|uniref:Uncharacterized protein n=1 Tax=Rhizobium phage RHph_Y65 TaxID=2509785 RepID=A0A7S5UYU6_9CAUD|nr:hypothetical protein PQC17_gp155 [Rhizobium phage RHph_Y65]QIG72713.1 hypothetical protein EVB97_155 [Rhizobium phage RHph_Y65]
MTQTESFYLLVGQPVERNPKFKIWEYDNRPRLNFFKKKPSSDEIARILGINHATCNDETLLAIAKIHRTNNIVEIKDFSYILQEVGFSSHE